MVDSTRPCNGLESAAATGPKVFGRSVGSPEELVGDTQCPIRRLGPPVAADEQQPMLAGSSPDQPVVDRPAGQPGGGELMEEVTDAGGRQEP